MSSIGVEEPVHVLAHLLNVDLIETFVDTALQRRNVAIRVGAARELLGRHLRGDEGRRTLDVPGLREFPVGCLG